MRRINWNDHEPESCPNCEEWQAIAEKAIRATTRMVAICDRTDKNFHELDESHREIQATLDLALAANEQLVALLRAERGK